MPSRRKGVSPIIAVILLIAFTLVVAGMVAAWVTQFVQQQRTVQTICAEAGFRIRGGYYTASSDQLSITVDNFKKTDLTFRIILEYEDGSIESPETIHSITAGAIETFSASSVADTLKTVTIRSEECQGAEDQLSALYIKGLGA